jgi:hypothetical protein
MIAATDDWHHRIVVIDPRTKRIVWQYGHFGIASSAPGFLSKPDGLDLLPAEQAKKPPAKVNHSTPQMHIRRAGSLPSASSRMAAVALPGGRIVAAGGLVGGSSSTQILAGVPNSLSRVGSLPVPTHDAAAAALGRYVYVFGGGVTNSTDRFTRLQTGNWRATGAGSIGEPLSDLGAAVTGGKAYLVGGYTGSTFATAILRVGQHFPVAARLPAGLRYAGVAALGGKIYVAGGVTTSGESTSVYAFDPARRTVRRVARLPYPDAHAPSPGPAGSSI